jgi:glutaredoxin
LRIEAIGGLEKLEKMVILTVRLVANVIRSLGVAMTSLLSRRVGSRPQVQHLAITVYTRSQCCCCHKALDLLRRSQRRHRFAMDEVDIDTDPDLAARYGESVPVVAINGKVRFRGVVNPVLFERLLVAEGRGR